MKRFFHHLFRHKTVCKQIVASKNGRPTTYRVRTNA